MKQKLISIALVLTLALAAALPLAGCSGGEYPVEVANIVVEKQPEGVVILDAPTADIISYMGYLDINGKSDEVTQEWLGVVPSMGTAQAPDAGQIKAADADIVFAGDELDPIVKDNLEKEGIQVITMSHAQTAKQLEVNYSTLGKILFGNITGQANGEKSYDELLGEMSMIKNSVTAARNNDVPDTVCYLYADGSKLKMMTSGTYGDMLLGYTGAVNAAVNIDENLVDVNTLKIANPKYIFYADDATLQKIKSDPTLSQLAAVKTNKMLMVTEEEMSRQGQTAIETLQKMVYFMYPELAPKSAATPDQAVQATTAPQPTTESVAEKYKIKITSKTTLKPEDENDSVKAMQQRLYDLGYVTDKENITGYYGEISEAAVKQFQKNNGLKETGTADSATLNAMFSSSAVKAKKAE